MFELISSRLFLKQFLLRHWNTIRKLIFKIDELTKYGSMVDSLVKNLRCRFYIEDLIQILINFSNIENIKIIIPRSFFVIFSFVGIILKQ